MRNIWKTVPNSQAIAIKQNVRLHGRMHPSIVQLDQNGQLDQIQNGQHVAIIDFNMCNIWKHD